MVGDAIESILSSVTQYVAGGLIPDSTGSQWIIYNMISNVPNGTKSAVSTLDRYRFQIDSYARSYSRADSLAAEVRSALDNYSGTVESVEIENIVYDGENDAPSSVEDLESRQDYFRRSQDYIIWIKP